MLNITSARKAKRGGIELNITPLIDMVFVLLIFFLVTTSFVRETGVEVNRPVSKTAVSKKKMTILVGVTKDDRIFIERRQIDIRALRIEVERALAENPEASVIIVADKDSKTGTVIRVMDECKLAGAKEVSIAALKESKGR